MRLRRSSSVSWVRRDARPTPGAAPRTRGRARRRGGPGPGPRRDPTADPPSPAWDRLRGWSRRPDPPPAAAPAIEAARGCTLGDRPPAVVGPRRGERRTSHVRRPHPGGGRLPGGVHAISIGSAHAHGSGIHRGRRHRGRGNHERGQWRSASRRNREARPVGSRRRGRSCRRPAPAQDGTPLAAAITLHGAGEQASDPEYRSELLDRAGMLERPPEDEARFFPHGARVNGLAWSPSGHRRDG